MLRLYNTLTRKKDSFKPIKDKKVRMYTCGPTVYDYAHIGNFRAYVAADLLRRYLEFKGFSVKQVMNLTDVDDKTIKGSQREGVSLNEYTTRYKKAFFEDLMQVNIKRAFVYPEATKHIPEMVNLIKKLLQKGIAYKSEDGSIYYNIRKFKGYGKLARLKVKELKVGARVKQDEYEKTSASDFALWKAYDVSDGDVFWNTELGKGRPGWHLECSAMSTKYLGNHFDIHTGGVDLIFPHHQNEIAQSEGALDEPFVNYWIHNEWLLVDGKKMSKSLGNFYTLRDIFSKGYNGREIRYLLLSTHYRQKLNFTFEGLGAAKNSLRRLDDFIVKLNSTTENNDHAKIDTLLKKYQEQFEKYMDDDLNISKALAVVFNLIRDINKIKISKKDAEKVKKLLYDFDTVFGILKVEEKIPSEIVGLAEKRQKLRQEKKFKDADIIRDTILKKGYFIEDTVEGYRIKKK